MRFGKKIKIKGGFRSDNLHGEGGNLEDSARNALFYSSILFYTPRMNVKEVTIGGVAYNQDLGFVDGQLVSPTLETRALLPFCKNPVYLKRNIQMFRKRLHMEEGMEEIVEMEEAQIQPFPDLEIIFDHSDLEKEENGPEIKFFQDVRMAYSKQVVDNYENPQNVGSLEESLDVGTGMVGAPACGDVMKLQIKVDVNGKITDAKFKAFGCGSAIASASYATQLLAGKFLSEAGEIKNTKIAKELALPPVKLHCSTLAQDAIEAAIADYRKKQQG